MTTSVRRISSILAVIALFVLIFAYVFSESSLKLELEEATPFEADWYVEKESSLDHVSEIPVHIDVEPGEPMVLRNTLPEAFEQEQSIMFRSSLQYAEVYLDDTLIHQSLDSEWRGLHIPVASHWLTVDLPEGSAGAELQVELTSPFEAMSGRINHIYYGSAADLHVQVLSEFGFDFVYALIVTGVGLIMLLSYLIFRTIKPFEMLYLGLFITGVGLWFLAESRMIQFVTGNQFLIGGLAYLAIALVPIPMLIYVRDVILSTGHRIMTFLTYTVFFWFIFIGLLQVTGVAGFFHTLPYSLIGSFILYSFMIFMMIREYFLFKNPDAARFLMAVLILMFFAILEGIGFFFNDPLFISDTLKIGFFLFIVLLGINTVQSIMTRLKKLQESQIYEVLAYTDQLTGGFNRMAFERDINDIYLNPDKLHECRLVYLDINDMKTINDVHGHRSGDEAIRMVYEIVRNVFKDKGHCYRIGGDEFACLVHMPDEGEYRILEKEILSAVREADQQAPYTLNVAMGSAVYDFESNTSISDWMHTADKAMYTDKVKSKSG